MAKRVSSFAAEKKKDKPNKNAQLVVLEGGPRNGEKLRIAKPGPEHMRLAFPEWCTYRKVVEGRYEYIGDVKAERYDIGL